MRTKKKYHQIGESVGGNLRKGSNILVERLLRRRKEHQRNFGFTNKTTQKKIKRENSVGKKSREVAAFISRECKEKNSGEKRQQKKIRWGNKRS